MNDDLDLELKEGESGWEVWLFHLGTEQICLGDGPFIDDALKDAQKNLARLKVKATEIRQRYRTMKL